VPFRDGARCAPSAGPPLDWVAAGSAEGQSILELPHYSSAAIASISTWAPRGKAATWTVARAGGCLEK
jgi:hypothetical protein